MDAGGPSNSIDPLNRGLVLAGKPTPSLNLKPLHIQTEFQADDEQYLQDNFAHQNTNSALLWGARVRLLQSLEKRLLLHPPPPSLLHG